MAYNIYSFFMAGQYPIVWIYTSLSIHLLVNENLGYLNFLAIVNNAAVEFVCQVFLNTRFQFWGYVT